MYNHLYVWKNLSDRRTIGTEIQMATRNVQHRRWKGVTYRQTRPGARRLDF